MAASGLFMMFVDFLYLMVVYLMFGCFVAVDFFCLVFVVCLVLFVFIVGGFGVSVNSIVYSLVTLVWVLVFGFLV